MADVVKFPSPAGLVAFSDLPERDPLVAWYSGFPDWRHKMQFAPGTLSVVTGHPGHGKTSLMANVWFNTAKINNLNVCVATFETYPVPNYRKLLRQFHAECAQSEMTDQQVRAADAFLEDHYRLLIHPQERPNIDWIFEWALKGGNEPDVLVIDPWNRLESQRGEKQTETEYIAGCLIDLRLFAIQNKCHVQIISHPAKRDVRFRKDVPSLEDISGSKNWDNMPDQGVCVHREEFWDEEAKARRFDAKVYHLKARFEELGYPMAFDVRLNPRTWCFEEVGQAAVERRQGGGLAGGMPPASKDEDEPPPPSYL